MKAATIIPASNPGVFDVDLCKGVKVCVSFGLPVFSDSMNFSADSIACSKSSFAFGGYGNGCSYSSITFLRLDSSISISSNFPSIFSPF